MTTPFSWTAPVWQADLDAFGELHNTTVLRLLQEAATRASTAAGFDAAYYDRIGCMWLIRRTRLVLADAARYGDEVTVRTWIADFRRVRSQREYELLAGTRFVGRAASDWVFVDRERGRPRRIPAEWNAAFGVGAAVGSLRTPFPALSPPTRGAVTRERRIELHDLDALRHVNNSNYVAYVEQGFYDLAAAVGCGIDAQLALGGRFHVLEHDLEYLDAALYDETIAVTSWVTSLTDDELEIQTHLHRGGPHRLLLHARSRYGWLAARGAALPAVFRAAFQQP